MGALIDLLDGKTFTVRSGGVIPTGKGAYYPAPGTTFHVAKVEDAGQIWAQFSHSGTPAFSIADLVRSARFYEVGGRLLSTPITANGFRISELVEVVESDQSIVMSHHLVFNDNTFGRWECED